MSCEQNYSSESDFSIDNEESEFVVLNEFPKDRYKGMLSRPILMRTSMRTYISREFFDSSDEVTPKTTPFCPLLA